jgi:hypothetical protein
VVCHTLDAKGVVHAANLQGPAHRQPWHGQYSVAQKTVPTALLLCITRACRQCSCAKECRRGEIPSSPCQSMAASLHEISF